MKKSIIAAALAALVLTVSLAAHAAGKLTGTVNVNTATAEQLMLLPGIGEAKANAIVEQRRQKAFSKKEELLLVKGIGETLLAKFEAHVTTEGPTTLKLDKSAE